VLEDDENNNTEGDKCKSNKGNILIESSLNEVDILDSINHNNNH